MKLHTKIISLLLVAGLASAGAQSAGSSASNFYVKGSVGIADPREKGIVGSFGGKKIGSTQVYSFEGGAFFGENLSFGFEYTFFNTDANFSSTLSSSDIASPVGQLANQLLQNSGFAGSLNEGPYSFKENYDSDRFMFVLNYEYPLADHFTFLFNGGLGVLNVENTLKASITVRANDATDTTPLSQNSKSDKTVFAYQIGAGLAYELTDAIDLYGQARYLGSSDLEFKHFGITNKVKGSAIAYELGLQYSF